MVVVAEVEVAAVSVLEVLVRDSNLCRHPSTASEDMTEVELPEQVAAAWRAVAQEHSLSWNPSTY